MNDTLINIKDVQVSFNGINIIKNISLDIKKGEIIALLGPSGCGKTTFLNILSGLLIPSQGEITLGSQNIIGTRKHSSYMSQIKENIIGTQKHSSYMFQDDLLLPWRNVYDNVMLPYEIEKQNLAGKNQIAKNLLEEFDLSDSLKAYPHQLSGGMKRRVAFVRTLCLDRDLYLFDEPTAGLDYLLRLQLEEKLFQFLSKYNKSAIIITHDVETAVSIADKVIILSQKPAQIIQEFEVGIARRTKSAIASRDDEQFPKVFQEVLKQFKNG